MNEVLTREQAQEVYYYLRLNRSLEELLARLFRQNKVFGGLYGSLGQEAVSVGAAYALAPGDWIGPMIRNIGGLLVRGYRPSEILMQHMGKADSPTHGREGTNHLGDLHGRRVVAPTSVLGDLIPVMAGVAMASRYLGQKDIALTWLGDGGTSTGVFHEGMNLAAVQRAALVVILENNQWAYSTPVSRQARLRDLAHRADAYGVFSMIADGNDVVAMVDAVRHAADRARRGDGPVLVEAKTMRMVGHAQHDSAAYVPREMMEYWKARDPIARFEEYLNARNWLGPDAKTAIEARIKREIEEDLAAAEKSPLPQPESEARGVYCEGDACHTVEPQWKRPKDELLPPKSKTDAAWHIEDFGAFQPPADSAHPAAAGMAQSASASPAASQPPQRRRR